MEKKTNNCTYSKDAYVFSTVEIDLDMPKPNDNPLVVNVGVWKFNQETFAWEMVPSSTL